MKMKRIITIKSLKLQKGMTLIELLVAGIISLIAVSGMVLVMASTLGTTSQTIKMSRLTHDMRTAMQIMTRELRRANYHSDWLACWGNVGCRTDLGITSQINEIQIGTNDTANDCLWFWYDRPQICPTSSCTTAELIAVQTDVTGESVAAFRRAVTDGVGRLQMTTTRTEAASCGANSDWVDITDPNIIDVMSFNVNNDDSFVEIFNVDLDSQRVEKISLTMTAKLKVDASVRSWIQSNTNGASRELTEFVSVRNSTTYVAAGT
jgi:type II secretory pathway pseudopilin PulG